MDTDDLSDKTYKGIITEAEIFNHDLTLQFGLLSGDCSNEREFIKKSEQLIYEMKRMRKDDLYDIFFGDPPSVKDFHIALNKILKNISLLK